MDEIDEAIFKELKDNGIPAQNMKGYIYHPTLWNGKQDPRTYQLIVQDNYIITCLFFVQLSGKHPIITYYDMNDPKFTFDKLIKVIKDHLDGDT